MAIINGELTIRIKYKDFNLPANINSKAVIYHECSQQAYLKSPFHKMSKNLTKENFQLDVISDNRKKSKK